MLRVEVKPRKQAAVSATSNFGGKLVHAFFPPTSRHDHRPHEQYVEK